MGTRNLTMVQLNNEIKIAQYGQWDGYLEGAGATIFDFLKNLIRNKNIEKFKENVRNCIIICIYFFGICTDTYGWTTIT